MAEPQKKISVSLKLKLSRFWRDTKPTGIAHKNGNFSMAYP
jgi:hypothetical protein